MGNTVIKVENLSKLYRLGEVGTGTISHDLNRFFARVQGKEDPFQKVGHINDRTQKAEKGEHVWALKDINFEVQQGEVLGIIGKNGAGKSTLLKLLSRVTAPTTGSIKVKGRVASLLEVGTGFHPEMTGRENIFMNGTILGMTRREIQSKLDAIVDFAGVAKYLDTPTKRYSSGMSVRLAFAVAAFLEPEILIVDEVLPVGDAEFQKRAIGKMQDISKGEGRTVLFVSHNMSAVNELCSSAMVLQYGKVTTIGLVGDSIREYLHKESKKLVFTNKNTKEEAIFISKVEIVTSEHGGIHKIFEPLKVIFEIFTNEALNDPAISFQIINGRSIPVLHILNLNSETSFCQKTGKNILVCEIPSLRLFPDTYNLKVNFNLGKDKGSTKPIENICSFEVIKDRSRDLYWSESAATYVENVNWLNKTE